MRGSPLALAAALALPVALAAQERSTRFAAAESRVAAFAASASASRVAGMAAAGLIGGGLGLVAGFYGVDAVCGIDDDLYCAEAALLSAAVVESALMPLGVHLANGRRGSYRRGVLATTVVGAAGLGLLFATDADPPVSRALAVGIPLAQLAAAIAVELRTSDD